MPWRTPFDSDIRSIEQNGDDIVVRISPPAWLYALDPAEFRAQFAEVLKQELAGFVSQVSQRTVDRMTVGSLPPLRNSPEQP